MVHRKEKATEICPSVAKAGWLRIPGLGAGVEARRGRREAGRSRSSERGGEGPRKSGRGDREGAGLLWPSSSRCRADACIWSRQISVKMEAEPW